MRTLPDHLRKGMKLVIVGCNPTESSVRVGHYYAGRDNPFWPIMYESGLMPEPFDYHDDKRVIEQGLKPDDRVVVAGVLRAVPGQKVDPQVQAPSHPSPASGGGAAPAAPPAAK